MKGVTFGSYHSFSDLHLILTDKTIGTPAPKIETIDIPGSDGTLDLTEFFGEVKYQNRPLSFKFTTLVPQSQFMTLFGMIQNALHGQKVNIALDDDPEWYYTGRVSVSSWKADKRLGKLTIDCDCEPFKHRVTSQAVSLAGLNLLNLDAGIATAGGTWTKTETGYTFDRGSATGGKFLYWNVPVAKGTQYTFSAGYSLQGRRLYVYEDSLQGKRISMVVDGNPNTFIAQKTGIYVFGLYCASDITTGTFENVMLQEGGTVGDYVAYDATSKEITATFTNARKAAVPTGYAAGTVEMQSDSVAQVLSPGKQLLDSFTFYKGNNTFMFKGNGIAVIEWEEGEL